MSRLASRANGATGLGDENDVCPVCKSSRYLNKNMKFLINPECYHRMCSSCVDRIFSHGPANCPIAGCKRTLRRNKFRDQRFEDLQVEREVDIRRRMTAIFNRREEEFDSLQLYNNYLNDAEDLTYNLLHGIDLAATEEKIKAYEAANAEEIRNANALALQEVSMRQARQLHEKEQMKLRREAARREEQEERREREQERRGVIDALATGDADAAKIARQSAAKAVEKRKSQLRRLQQTVDAPFNAPTITIRGLKQKKDELDEPYDPFGGFTYEPAYYVQKDAYNGSYLALDKVKRENLYVAGGYDINEFYQRTLCEAFSGLGVFINEEMENKEVLPKAAVETDAAVIEAPKVKVKKSLASDDVF